MLQRVDMEYNGDTYVVSTRLLLLCGELAVSKLKTWNPNDEGPVLKGCVEPFDEGRISSVSA